MSRAVRVSTFKIPVHGRLKNVASAATGRGGNHAGRSIDDCTETVVTRTRVFAALAIAAAVLGVAGTVALPVASADTLPNGLDIICNPADGGVTCVIGGCPRVNGDHVVDAVHVRDSSGRQDNLDFKCINGALASKHFAFDSQFTIGVQACRKNSMSSDDCTAYSSYTYTPPAPRPAPPRVNIGPPVIVGPAPAPAPAPAPPPPKVPPAPPTKRATVSADVDLYDVPGGNGKVVGMLRQGQQLQLLQRRPDNWCQVSGTTVAGHDTGWAFGDYISG